MPRTTLVLLEHIYIYIYNAETNLFVPYRSTTFYFAQIV